MNNFSKPIAGMVTGLAFLSFGLGSVKADTLAGPTTWTVSGGNDTVWGIQFTALTNSTLTGFDFNHKDNTNVQFGNNGLSGNIYLDDITTSTTDFSAAYGGFPTPAVVPFTGLNIALTAGNQYQLVAAATTGADEVFQYLPFNNPPLSYPDADSDIAVTQGVFNNNPGFQEAFAWGAFNNITTTGTNHVGTTSTPEPGAYAMFASLGITGAAFLRRKRAR